MPDLTQIYETIDKEFPPDGDWLILLRNVTDVEREGGGGRSIQGPWFAHLMKDGSQDRLGRPTISFQAEAETREAALLGVLTQAREWDNKRMSGN